MSEIPYNPLDHSEERIERYYSSGNVTVNLLNEMILSNYVDEQKIVRIQNNIGYLEELIAFNCWNNHDISSWTTIIEQSKSFLETHLL
jgi:hypothetical protein